MNDQRYFITARLSLREYHDKLHAGSDLIIFGVRKPCLRLEAEAGLQHSKIKGKACRLLA
jgi:hypothetical protein